MKYSPLEVGTLKYFKYFLKSLLILNPIVTFFSVAEVDFSYYLQKVYNIGDYGMVLQGGPQWTTNSDFQGLF